MFLPITLILYFVIPEKMTRTKNVILLAMSLVFYALGEIKYFGVMIESILVNYFIAVKMNGRNKKILLILDIIFNVGRLGVFKYLNFFIDTINYVPALNIKHIDIGLPIGISFLLSRLSRM